MKIGVLETGPVLESLVGDYGPYTDFFERMIKGVDDQIEVKGWVTFEGELPKKPSDMDGWIVTGSKYGAYEDHPWIPPLEQFLRDCLSDLVPVAGFCFGHQILAQAAGGTVQKSDKGWGLGVHDYKITKAVDWMGANPKDFSAIAIHQDQVTAKPENATVIASSEFCENAALAYGDPNNPMAISVQPHPEFDRQFADRLIKDRRGNAFPEATSDAALATLEKDVDNAAWAAWVVDFFRRAQFLKDAPKG